MRIEIDTPSAAGVTLDAVRETSVTIGAAASGSGGSGGDGPPPVPFPSEADFDWNVTRDIAQLAREHEQPTEDLVGRRHAVGGRRAGPAPLQLQHA